MNNPPDVSSRPNTRRSITRTKSANTFAVTLWSARPCLFSPAMTVALSYVNLGSQKANVAVAMLVATFKAGLVAYIFMHLSAEKKLIYRILIFTAIFVFGLFWLTYLAWYDPVVH